MAEFSENMSFEKKNDLIMEIFDEINQAANDGYFRKIGESDILVVTDDSKEPVRMDKLMFAEILANDQTLYTKFHDAYLNAKNK